MSTIKLRVSRGKYRRVDLKPLCELELRALLGQLQKNKDYLDIQPETDATATGSIILGQQIAKVQTELGLKMRSLRKENEIEAKKQAATFERQFLYQAKRLLPTDLYEACLCAAKEATKSELASLEVMRAEV